MRDKMKAIRHNLGLTQDDIAKVIGVARSTYTNIELGTKNPSFEVSLKIKKILNVVNDEIFLKS